MSLPRPVRMTRRREFEAVRLRGSSVGGKLLAIGFLEQPEAGNQPEAVNQPIAVIQPKAVKLMAGVIVPKAIGCAPVRNRLKRCLREIIREALPTMEREAARPAFVTIARRASAGADFVSLRAEWHRLARKAGLCPPRTVRSAPPSMAAPITAANMAAPAVAAPGLTIPLQPPAVP
jgi:ribonuclease P protein component